jgi:uncharacterized protein YjbI with pentapeptide repeats
MKIFLLIVITANVYANEDLGFRHNNVTGLCTNSMGHVGRNPDFVGECGQVRSKNMSNLKISHTNLKAIDLSFSNFNNANLSLSDLTHSHLFGTDFHSANLEQVNMSLSALRKTTFRYANLKDAIIMHAIIIRADFVSADLTGAILSDSNILATNFDSANLENADLRNVNFLGNGHFGPSNLENVIFKGAKFNLATKLPFDKQEAIRKGMVYILD